MGKSKIVHKFPLCKKLYEYLDNILVSQLMSVLKSNSRFYAGSH